MPATVSSISSSSGTGAPSRAPVTPTDSGDGQSFSDELGRAKNQASSSSAHGADSKANVPESAAKTDPGKLPATAKPVKNEKAAGKNRSGQATKADSAIAKQAVAKDTAQADPETDPDESDAGNGQQGEASPERKPQKKTADATEANATAGAVANASIQAAATPTDVTEAHQLVADTAPRRAQSAGSKDSQEAENPAEAPVAGTTKEISDPGDSAQSPSQSASRTGRSSKARSPVATKDDGDTASAPAQDAAAGIPAIAIADNSDDSDAGATTDSVTANTTSPIAKAVAKTTAATPPTGVIQNGPGNLRTSDVAINSTNDAAQTPPEAQFADANRSQIVSGITGKLLPDGGSMQLTLDPANLGPLLVRVEMKNGVISASFETTNDQASKLLSHSLGDLKSALESQGVTVEKLHVSQSSKEQPSSGDSRQGASDQGQNSASQQEQQRKDMMRRMWRKLMKGQDPLDLVA